MARQTTNDIENLLGNTGFVAFLEQYIAEYVVPKIKAIVTHIDKESTKVASAMANISGAGTTGLMLQPADTEADPTKRNDNTALQSNDWYVNTKDAEMKWYNKKDDDWYSISLSPLFDAALITWKANVGDNSYVNKDEYISLEEIVKETLTNEETLAVSDKWLDGINLRKLFKDNLDTQKRNLVDATDEVVYVAADRLEYRDKDNDLRTGYPEVVKIGNTVTYTTILHPYERLHQIGASFTGTFEKAGMSVLYSLSASNYNTKAIGLNFVDKAGATRDTYTLTSINKVEGDNLIHYIRISGTATLEIKEAVLPGQTANVIETVDLSAGAKDIKASELFPSDDDNAIVIFNFTAVPSIGDKFLQLEFDAPAQFIVNRYVNEMKKIQANIAIEAKNADDKIKEINNQYPTWNIGGFTDAFGSAMYSYSKFPQIIAMVGKKAPDTGERFLWEVPVDANLAGKGTIMLTKDGANMEVVYPEDRANSDINDPSNVGKPVIGKSIADIIETNWLILEKKLDNNNKVYWKWVGLKRKPADPRGMKIVSTKLTDPAQALAKLQAFKADRANGGSMLVSVEIENKARFDIHGAAVLAHMNSLMGADGTGGWLKASNNQPYETKVLWNAIGSSTNDKVISIDTGDTHHESFSIATFDWTFNELKGSAYTTTDTMLEDLAKGKANGQYVIQVTDGVPTLVAK